MSAIMFCSHWRGSQTSCRADIDVETVRDADGRVPCAIMRGVTGSLRCDRLDVPAAAAAEHGRMARLLDRLENGLCPICGEMINGEMDLNDNIVALPCRHVIKHARD